MTTALISVGCYFLVSLVITSTRAWFIGLHRGRKHSGDRKSGCEHWACDFMASDFLIVLFLFWPVFTPILLLFAWYRLLIRGAHLSTLPPENEHPGKRHE